MQSFSSVHKLLGVLVKTVRAQAVLPADAPFVQMTVGPTRSDCLTVHVEAHLTQAIKTTGVERP